jgi:hypothetical protein
MTVGSSSASPVPPGVFPAFATTGDKWTDLRGDAWVFRGIHRGWGPEREMLAPGIITADQFPDVLEAMRDQVAKTEASLKANPEPEFKGSAVEHPSHYNSHPSGIECIEIVRHMTFNTGNVFKYLWRAGLKDSAPTLQDHRKALFYLQDEITRLEKEEANGSVQQG